MNESHRRILFQACLNVDRLRVGVKIIVVIADHMAATPRVRFVVVPFLDVVANRMSLTLLTSGVTSGASFALRIVASDVNFMKNIPIFRSQSSLNYSCEVSRTANGGHAIIRVRESSVDLRIDAQVARLSLTMGVNGTALHGCGKIVNFMNCKDVRYVLLKEHDHCHVLLRQVNEGPLSPLRKISRLRAVPCLRHIYPLGVQEHSLHSATLEDDPAKRGGRSR